MELSALDSKQAGGGMNCELGPLPRGAVEIGDLNRLSKILSTMATRSWKNLHLILII